VTEASQATGGKDVGGRTRTAAWALGIVGLAALVGLLATGRHPSAPVATWQFGEDRKPIGPFDRVPMFEDMRLVLDLPTAGYVYVASFDLRRGTTAYYPTDYLDTDHEDPSSGRMNRFPAGRHELPGAWQGKDQVWSVPDVEDEAVGLCVVFSREPLPELESALRSCVQVGNIGFPDKSMGRYMPRGGSKALLGRRQLPHEILRAAARQLEALVEGPMVELSGGKAGRGVFVKTLNIIPDKPRPGVQRRINPVERHLRELIRSEVKPSTPK